jgi:WD40 repeat protein
VKTRSTLLLACAVLMTPLLAGCFGLDFSPDGKQIAAVIANKLVVASLDGGNRKEIAAGKGVAGACFSPDGHYLAFVNGTDAPTDLCLYDLRTQKTRVLGKNYLPFLGWREDGRRLAALQQPDQNGPLYLVQYNLPEGGPSLKVRLPFADVDSLNLTWIPMTDNVALIGGKDQRDVYAVEYGEVHKITTTGDVVGLALSPDKNHLVFARRGPNLKYILLSVYAFDLTKRRVGRLAFPERLAPLNPNPHTAPKSVDYAAISPDMKRLAIVAELTNGKMVCCVSGFDGKDVRIVRTSPPQSILVPVWSRDGSKIAVQYIEDKTAGVSVFDKSGEGGTRVLLENL